ncbi:hypothetical protein EV121DRAFT_281721 [Schizophyllum commune]
MRLFLEFARDRELMPETPEEARKDIIFALHWVRVARAYATLSAAFHQAFVVHPVPFIGHTGVRPGPRKWYAQLLVHDVRADCLIVGRTGRRDEVGDGIDDQEMDHSDLPPDPLKICIPKAASILIQPTDTILAYFYRVDADHFVLGKVEDYRPYDLAHRHMNYEDDDEAEEIPFTAPIRDPLRARSLDPAFLVKPDGSASVVPGTIIPLEPDANEISVAPFRVDDEQYQNREDRELFPPEWFCAEALAPPFAVWGPDGLPLHHMRRARDDPDAGEADRILAHDDVGYRARRARLLALPSPFDVPGIPVYPQGVDISIPGPDYDVARMAGLMDPRPASVRSATTFLGIPTSSTPRQPGILPIGHPAYRVFNMPPLPEAWYEAREPMFEDEPVVSSFLGPLSGVFLRCITYSIHLRHADHNLKDYSSTSRCLLLDRGQECSIHASVVPNFP